MAYVKDLVVIVPDGAISNVIATLLEKRRPSLHISDIDYDVIKDSLHDSSPITKAVELLRGYFLTHERAMVLRDLAGSGWERRGSDDLEQSLLDALISSGWSRDRIAAIVIDPELEIWLRLRSQHVQKLVEERARWNIDRTGLLFAQQVQASIHRCGGEAHGKPRQPKEAFEAILEQFGIPRSNALYRELAKHESLEGCMIPSFQKLVHTLRGWFPAEANSAAPAKT